MLNCRISNNRVDGEGGGGICAYTDEQLVISNCVIENNYGAWGGGGIFEKGYSGAAKLHYIVNCTISRNGGDAGCGGGILAAYNTTNTIIRNCVINHNFSSSDSSWAGGAGVVLLSATSIVENCTIVSNVLTGVNRGGGGIRARGPGVKINNCIICSNSSASAWANSISNSNWSMNESTWITFTNSCTYPTNYMEGSGNITNDPLFVSWGTTNLRLNANSPCVNTGANRSWMTNSYDLDGKQRIRYGIVDMGAYERIYDGTIYSVR